MLNTRLVFCLVTLLMFHAPIAAKPQDGPRVGFNLVKTDNAPFGSRAAESSLNRLRSIGVESIALVPFFWQEDPEKPGLVLGSDMSLEELRTGIRQAHAAGFDVMVKPHVWVPETWAGDIVMGSDEDWKQWFENYAAAVTATATVAQEESAESLSVGTELKQSILRPEWFDLIETVRTIYSGQLLYVSHGADDAEKVPFWDPLDAIGVTLYPALGADGDSDAWTTAMSSEVERLSVLAKNAQKQVWIAEIGIRSAKGAAAKPWESAEERKAPADDILQAKVLGVWLDALQKPFIEEVMVWRWFTDPEAGGRTDTDFTVQGKITEGVIYCHIDDGC